MGLIGMSGAVAAAMVIAGCGGGKSSGEAEEGPFKIVLQTDWYAQPEHGGFYQALAMGYYADEGLEVEILPGGPNSLVSQKVAQGTAQFGIGRSDDVIISVGRDLPLVMVGALMQKDPQAIMFHKSSGIESISDLDGRPVMVTPGSAFIQILKRKYNIDFPVIPLDYGMNRFLADKDFIQQCFVTNEPFYVGREGADVGTILLSDSGFNPYRVWFTSRSFVRRHPDKVAAFTRASIRGWQDYLFGERSEANALIASRNPKMDEEFMEFSTRTMREQNLITGDGGDEGMIGTIDPERIAEQIQQLVDIDMIAPGLSVDDVYLNPATLGAPQAAVDAGASDLIIRDFEGSELALVRAETLSGFPLQTRQAPIETAELLATVRGLPLLDVLAEAPINKSWDLALANCSDGYQSNYTREILRSHQPFLILEIEGQTTAEWAASKGRPDWGPFMIHTFITEDLLDPVNKNPWGVEELRVGTLQDLLGSLFASSSSTLAAHPGFQVFKSNCASCHRFTGSEFGGTVSTRNSEMLSLLARHSEPYFRAMLRDPVGTNALAAKMPAATHYDDAQVVKLIEFLAAYGR